MDEAHRQQHQVGLDFELAAGNRLHLVVDAHAMKFDLAVWPENFWSHGEFALAPSSWLDEVRSFSGQFGQVSALFSRSGGAA
jgi:hypothetical protein